MDLDACGVQRDGFDPDTHDLRTLQLLEHAIQDASFGPAIHARVNRVPVAEAFGQSAPLATMFGHIEDRIDHLQIAQADVATLPGQAVFNGSELFGRDLHVGDFLAQSSPSPLVLTRPRFPSDASPLVDLFDGLSRSDFPQSTYSGPRSTRFEVSGPKRGKTPLTGSKAVISGFPLSACSRHAGRLFCGGCCCSVC